MPRNSQNVEAIVEAMSIKYNNRVYEMQSQTSATPATA